jgi:hypothetical protein
MVLSRVLPSLECVLQKCISYHCRSTLAKYRYTFTPQASVHGQSESGFQSASRCFRCRNDQLTGSPEDDLPAVAAVAARGRRQALDELAAREARARLFAPGEVRGGRCGGEADEGEEGDGKETHGEVWRSTSLRCCPLTPPVLCTAPRHGMLGVAQRRHPLILMAERRGRDTRPSVPCDCAASCDPWLINAKLRDDGDGVRP